MSTDSERLITPEMNRHNGWIFFWSNTLIYLSAPAVYVGVIQAALCHSLGASDTIANLPAATFLVGQFAPLVFSWLIPHRHEKATVIWSARIWAVVVIMVLVALMVPLPAGVRIAVLSVQGLLQGAVNGLVQVFSFQCLGRGTTEKGRAWAMKWTFSIGPIAAVIGSSAAQYILHPGFSWARFPMDFGLIYLWAAPCIVVMAILQTRWRMMPLADEPRPPFFNFFVSSFRAYGKSKALVFLFLAYLLLMCVLSATPTLSLHTKVTMGQEPKELTGWTLIMRFGCKAAGGFLLGILGVRYGLRASVIACLGFCTLAIIWAGTSSGYWYLFTFGLMGVGELGGAYIPAYGLSLAATTLGARNLSILSLAVPAAWFAPVLIGRLADQYGFSASLAFALASAVVGMLLVWATKPLKTQGSES